MGFLISRLGHEVKLVRHGEDAGDVAASIGAAVVVLDGSDSLAGMTEEVAAIERLVPESTVIVVTDATTEGDHCFRVVPKWNPFDELGIEIEVAAAAATRSVSVDPTDTSSTGLYLRATPT
jgi:hypothetical protein